MSNQDPYGPLRNQASNAPGRIEQKIVQISAEPVTEKTVFLYEKRTLLNGQDYITQQFTKKHPLACGCYIDSPARLYGICPVCALSPWVRLMRIKRYVCTTHQMCLKCRRKLLRQRRGGGFFYTLFAILLWPSFDVTPEDDHEPH